MDITNILINNIIDSITIYSTHCPSSQVKLCSMPPTQPHQEVDVVGTHAPATVLPCSTLHGVSQKQEVCGLGRTVPSASVFRKHVKAKLRNGCSKDAPACITLYKDRTTIFAAAIPNSALMCLLKYKCTTQFHLVTVAAWMLLPSGSTTPHTSTSRRHMYCNAGIGAFLLQLLFILAPMCHLKTGSWGNFTLWQQH